MYTISLIIPIYNVQDCVESSLTSALNQTFDSIEYILVDDCGTDNSMSIVNRIKNTHARGKDIYIYHHDHNKGLSAARNTGLSKARGKYIFFMDSDDELTVNCIDLHYNEIIKTSADFTIANTELIGKKSIHIKQIQYIAKDLSPLESFLKGYWLKSAWNHLYDKTFIDDHCLKFCEGILHEDLLWSFQASCAASKISIVTEKTYKYIIRNNSITTSKNSSRKIDSFLQILSTMNDYYLKGTIPKSLTDLYEKYISFICFNCALLLLTYAGKYRERKEYYHKIQKYNNTITSIYSLILKLPFFLFYIVAKPPYIIYKRH